MAAIVRFCIGYKPNRTTQLVSRVALFVGIWMVYRLVICLQIMSFWQVGLTN